jgi:hypothetical protein
VALVRVYCGLAAAEPRQHPGAAGMSLTIAMIDDVGRLLDIRDVEDHPKGYASLSSLLAERANGPYSVMIAADSDQHLVTRLLAAAGWALGIADHHAVDEFADRYVDELTDDAAEALARRRAVGLARALHAGALTATALPAPPELIDLKPLLAADSAIATGRHGATVALREVLRELYPAALRAYPDPADPVALAVMDALPEPGALAGSANGRGRDAAAAADAATARLTADGVADPAVIAEAITALRVAIAETPRRGVPRALAATVAETVRRTVAAVRACDESRNVLISALAQRVWAPPAAPAGMAPAGMAPAGMAPVAAGPPSAAVTRGPLPPRMAAQVTSPAAMTSPAPVSTGGLSATPTSARPASGSPHGPRPVSAPPPPPGITPITDQRPGYREDPQPSYWDDPHSGHREVGVRADPQPVPWGSSHSTPAAPAATTNSVPSAPAVSPEDRWMPAPRVAPEGPPPGSRSGWPTAPPGDDWAAVPASAPPARPVAPPWQADDLRRPELPSLRLVEPTLPEELRDELGSYGGWSEPPPLRLVEPDDSIPRSIPPVGSTEADGDLLIFAQARSAWFTDHDDVAWNSTIDEGWRAAEQATRPTVDDHTRAGLPRRVPHANLVPGSAPVSDERPLRVVRDPASIAAHTSGYFNGWRRGQEVGGYALGTRSGQSAGAWDFARDDRMSG